MWADFHARPPASLVAAAVTSTSLEWGFQCRGEAFSFHVLAEFHPDTSWVNPQLFARAASDGALLQTLQHERLHFDITEVQARRLRQLLATLNQPCARTEEEISRLGNRLLQEEDETQKRYDAETEHGLRGVEQARWDREVGETLRSLAVYGPRP